MIFIINNNSYMNQDKSLNNLQLEKSTSRRSRKDEEGRDFQCGCGKRYLSYPALYTHIKTKHDGRQPEGTQKTATTMAAKRTKGKNEDDSLKCLTNYLDRSDIKLLAQLDQNHLGSVSVGSRFKKQAVPKQIIENYQNLIKHPELILSKNSNLDTLLALYLFNLGEYVNERLYDHYLIFAKLLRNCYFEHAEDVFKSCFSNREGPTFIENFTVGQVQYVPIICDCMLRYYIPLCQSSKEYKGINLSLMELMLADFCSWLYKRKYTNIKVTLKKEYRLETKPELIPKQHYHSHGNNSSKEKDESLSSVNKKEKRQWECSNSEDQMSDDQMIDEGNDSIQPSPAPPSKLSQQPEQAPNSIPQDKVDPLKQPQPELIPEIPLKNNTNQLEENSQEGIVQRQDGPSENLDEVKQIPLEQQKVAMVQQQVAQPQRMVQNPANAQQSKV